MVHRFSLYDVKGCKLWKRYPGGGGNLQIKGSHRVTGSFTRRWTGPFGRKFGSFLQGRCVHVTKTRDLFGWTKFVPTRSHGT